MVAPSIRRNANGGAEPGRPFTEAVDLISGLAARVVWQHVRKRIHRRIHRNDRIFSARRS